MPRAGLSLLQYLESGLGEFSPPIYKTSSATGSQCCLISLAETSNLKLNFTNNSDAATFDFKSASLRPVFAEILCLYGCNVIPLWVMRNPFLSVVSLTLSISSI